MIRNSNSATRRIMISAISSAARAAICSSVIGFSDDLRVLVSRDPALADGVAHGSFTPQAAVVVAFDEVVL